MSESYAAGKWKCELPDCVDPAPHRHAISDLIAKIVALTKEQSTEAFKVGVKRNMDDALKEQQRLFAANSRLSIEVDKLRSQVAADREALLRCQYGISEAMHSEDGLDGAEGQEIMRLIDKALRAPAPDKEESKCPDCHIRPGAVIPTNDMKTCATCGESISKEIK